MTKSDFPEVTNGIGTFLPDPLQCDVELPLHGVYHPLGFTLEIATNSGAALAAAQESWGQFRKSFSEPSLQLRVGVVEGSPNACPAPPVARGQRNLVAMVTDAENFAVLDLREGFAFSWLTKAIAENRPYLRYHFFEGIVLALLDYLYLSSIHAACVALDGHGVLLCGNSHSGKSSLAYACARRGWTFVSDDTTRIVRKRSGRLAIGNPHHMRFRDSAIKLFPELAERRIAPRVTGELAIEVATASMPEIVTAAQCSIDYIAFLNRGKSGPARAVLYPREKAMQWFEQTNFFWEQSVQAAKKESLRDLLAAQAFELSYSDLESAVRQLETIVRSES
jgi:hypothetical protein